MTLKNGELLSVLYLDRATAHDNVTTLLACSSIAVNKHLRKNIKKHINILCGGKIINFVDVFENIFFTNEKIQSFFFDFLNPK